MGYIKQLKNENGDCVYPLTKAEAVYIQKTDGTTVKQQKLDDKLAEMESSFQAGCDTLVNKLKELGITPSSSSPTDIAAAIQTACSTYYNKGVAAADNRVNGNSASYKQGVTDADNRVDGNSASYKQGYSNGYAQGKADADTTSAYNNGYNAGVAAGKQAVNGSVSCSGDLGLSKEDVHNANAYVTGSVSATASISNGKLSVSISGSENVRVVAWEGDEARYSGDSSRGVSGSNSKQVA